MSAGKVLRIYLDNESRARAQAGTFNIMSKIKAAFEGQGYRVLFAPDTETERMKSAARRGYTLFHMADPFHERALTLRRAYYYPFWRIETSAKRWEWDVAKAAFPANQVDRDIADKFAANWRSRIFPKLGEVTSDGFVYVPLQGRLLDHRSFQTQSPLDMIRSVLAYETSRDVIVALHPKETYSFEERDAIKTLVDKHPRLQISAAPMDQLLARCDYVVTENSSVALAGYFLGKPAALFAQIDFHHIAAKVSELGSEEAIRKAPKMAPDFNGYLHWFLKQTSINGGAPEAEDQILDAVRRHGWEL